MTGAQVALGPIGAAHEHAAALALARNLLHEIGGAGLAGSTIAARRGGQPFLPARPDIGISLSHSGDWAAAAVGVGIAVGVDVQVPQPTSPGLLRRCCRPAERDALARMSADRRDLEFAWLWTAQEACVKATGAGLGGLPWTIPVHIGQVAGDWQGVRWQALRDFPLPVSCAYVDKEAARC